MILVGHVLDRLRELPDESVHSVVTDPPYELGFMGKSWDSSGIAYSAEMWREALRVLNPGGHLLAFGGTRTYHRMACAIEDAGFEIRDQLQWIYGSGFPKSLDVSKAIDKAAGAEREVVGTYETNVGIKGGNFAQGSQRGTVAATVAAQQWEGWGTALKPANEPICLARKPLSQPNVAANVLKHGTGAMNIDGCRIDAGEDYTEAGFGPRFGHTSGNRAHGDSRPWIGERIAAGEAVKDSKPHEEGRFPSNVILDEEAAAMLDEQSGYLETGNTPKVRSADKHRKVYAGWKGEQCLTHRAHNGGGASRFFYCAKASQDERGYGNTHPTVKPVDLMRYLVRLVTPRGGTVLDLFAGSGTTGMAAMLEGFDFILIEREDAYIPIIERRLASVTPAMRFDEEVARASA